MIRRLLTVITAVFLTAVPALASQPPSPGQDGFVPASSLPPGQQLPAAPFLIGAYAFFLVLMMVYLWSIWRRINKVEREIQELDRRSGRGAAR
jgi:type VI protein secretion system component VasF